MQTVVILVYEDILEFYGVAIKFFRRRLLHLILKLSWNDINVRIRHIIDNMKRHQDLVDKEAQAEDIERSQRQREDARTKMQTELLERTSRKKKEVMAWLGSVEHLPRGMRENSLQKMADGTGEWLLRSSELQDWMSGTHHLWLHGKPGAGMLKSLILCGSFLIRENLQGKTILSSIVLNHIDREDRPHPVNKGVPILYFYCSYKVPEKNTYLAILCALISQLAAYDDQLILYLWEEHCRTPQSPSVEMCQDLLKNSIQISVPPNERLYMVVDGLDELPASERKNFITFMSKLLSQDPKQGNAPSSTMDSICLYIASQDEYDIRAFISPKRRGTRFIPTRSVAVDQNVIPAVFRISETILNDTVIEFRRHLSLYRAENRGAFGRSGGRFT